MAGYWLFTNVTKSVTFEPRLNGLHIHNAQPCELATLTCTIDDPEADQEFESHDVIRVTFNSVKIYEGMVERYERVGTGPGPRTYELSAQDYTALFGRCVIDERLGNTTTVTNRVNDILDNFDLITITRDIESISDEVDPLNSKGMYVEAALRDTATEVGGSAYIDFEKEAKFFVTPPVVAAPFGIVSSESPDWSSTDVPINGLRLAVDSQPQANAVYVKGTGVSVWRIDSASIAAYATAEFNGRFEHSINDPSITTLRKAQRIGDAALAALSVPQTRGQVNVTTPGIEPLQTLPVDARTHWDVNADFIVTSTDITYIDLFTMNCQIAFADRFTPCNARNPSAGDLAQGDTDDGGDDGGGGGDCIDCTRAIGGLSTDFTDPLAMAFGRSLAAYVFDGATMAKYSCAIDHIWTATIPGSDVGMFGHEPGSETPVLAFPKGIGKSDGDTLWNRSGELTNPTAAVPMDQPRFWVVGESTTGGGGGVPYGGLGAFDVDAGPSAEPLIIWRCYIDTKAGPHPIRVSWTAGQIYKALGTSGGGSQEAYAKVYAKVVANASNDPPDAADINALGALNATPFVEVIGLGGTQVSTNGPLTGWLPLSAGSVNLGTLGITTGAWLVFYAYSVHTTLPSTHTFGDGGLDTTLTVAQHDSLITMTCTTGGGGGGSTGPVLQSRNSRTGGLIASVDLDEGTDQIRATPNSQHVFLYMPTAGTLERYDRDLDLIDTVTIASFATGLQEWCVDDDFNIYRLAAEVAYKYNRDGELLWSNDLNASENYTYPTEAGGKGQSMIVDEHLRIAGQIGIHPGLLTVGRPVGNVRSAQKFKTDGTSGALLAVARNGQCLVLAGKHDGTEIDNEPMTSDRWLMRLWAARAE